MRKNRVIGSWDVKFHAVVNQARKQYSRQLGKDINMTDVTRIWGEGKLARFKIPPLKLRGEYVKRSK